MKKFLFALFLFPLSLTAQHFEVGIMAGASNYLGDLSSNSSILYMQETGFAGGVFAKYNFHYLGAIRMGFNVTQLSGEDANSSDMAIQQRNLSFVSDIYEGSLIAEINIPGYDPYNLNMPFSPYLFAGVSYFYYNPQATYQGETYDLRTLGTEGQGIPGRAEPYGKYAFAIPMGIGFKYAISDLWNLGLELGVRRTFTDYLDDVSTTYVEYSTLAAANGEIAAALSNRTGEFLGTEPISVPTGTLRGDDSGNDWFFILGLTLSYNFLDNGLVGARGRLRRRSGCNTD
ncbi:MAG: DUF6089 family protein [Saprospiraceae bacterium]|nr:DUF6089 family protein [Saprospiraceae bacterium]